MILGSWLSWFTDRVQTFLEGVSGPWLYVVTFIITFAETGTLLFFIPGEFTLLFAGAAAGAGSANLGVLIFVGIAAALLGDFVGFHLGSRYGDRIRSSKIGRRIPASSWDKTQSLIKRRKGLIVLVGRWVGFVRAVMPASAGMSGMKYKDFLPWDVAGAASWATLCVFIGFQLGDNIEKIETWISRGGYLIVGVLTVGWFVKHSLSKRAERA
jgi:membrane-associated protein